MSNLPDKYSLEAQDKRNRDRKMAGKNPKSRVHWGHGSGISQEDWDRIFAKREKNGS